MTLDYLTWCIVPGEVDRLCKAASTLIENSPPADYLWCNPDSGTFHVGPSAPDTFGDEPWLPVKSAAGGAFRPLFDAMQLTPNAFNRFLGGPTPLASSLAGGLLGAGLGYGGGYAVEKILGPKVLAPGRLRRLGAVAGGAVGTLPGAYLGSVGYRMNAEDGKNPWAAFIEPNKLFGKESADLDQYEDPEFLKMAEGAGGFLGDPIPVDAFNRVIWNDPNTPIGIRAATTGLVDAAAQLRGGTQFITPYDIGRVALGMGSGLASGMLVGKALGAMAGLTPEYQQTLQRAGMWGGVLVNIVPKAFGF